MGGMSWLLCLLGPPLILWRQYSAATDSQQAILVLCVGGLLAGGFYFLTFGMMKNLKIVMAAVIVMVGLGLEMQGREPYVPETTEGPNSTMPSAPQMVKDLIDTAQNEARSRQRGETTPADPEAAAASLFKIAQHWARQGDNALAAKWLRKIVDRYPQTEAAQEAMRLLQQRQAQQGQ